MRGWKWTTLVAGAIAASGLSVGWSAEAHDRWRWERRHEHRHHGHRGPERRVIIQREVIERRPVYVEPAPILMAPMMPAYGYGGPVEPSLNLNFQIPLR